MNVQQSRYRFIPFRRGDIVEMCIQSGGIGDRSEPGFRQLADMLAQIFHFEFHRVAESLKEAYGGLDPDTDTLRPDIGVRRPADAFVDLLEALLEKANYERIAESDLNRALSESSMFDIRLHVDFSDFDEVLLFARGVSQRRETLRSWFGLRARTIEFVNFDRVVIYLRVRDDYDESRLDLAGCRAGATLLKLFRNVPRADLEMLFPNTEIRMRLRDKLLIGIPAVVSGGIVLTTKLGASLVVLGSLFGYWIGVSQQPAELNQTAIIALLGGAVALVGYLWKQFNNFKNRKLRFAQALTRNLYFKNLDNNAGVFYRLINDAEEEECKEAILAYCFLRASAEPLSRGELDRRIEAWFAERWDCELDFEIDDALRKLVALGLVEGGDEALVAVDIDRAIALLDRRWDDYFRAPAETAGAA